MNGSLIFQLFNTIHYMIRQNLYFLIGTIASFKSRHFEKIP